jgi:hypothetical protein
MAYVSASQWSLLGRTHGGRALQARIAAKVVQKYAARPGLDEFDLLVHYDLAWACKSPDETLTFKLADAARAGAGGVHRDDPGAFDHTFSFVPHNEAQKVFRLDPWDGP